jgi:cystathionine beta-lyase/cystathionine gamma-synthase
MTKNTRQTATSVPFTQSGSSPPAGSTTPFSPSPIQAGPQTAAIHAGLGPDPATGSILTPIYQTATYSQPALGETVSPDGHTYSRCSNPTVSALEANLAGLEGVPHALAFKTGLAAITTLFFTVLRPGDHVVASEVIYGGSVRLLRDLLGSFGVESTFVDSTDTNAVAQAVRENTKLLFIETPANPTLILSDLAALGKLANDAGILFAVDNTFLTGVLQPVFCHGADVSVLSTTKYVEGHDSTTGGALLTKNSELNEKFKLTRSTTGSIQAPFDAWLTLRGLKTLPLRLQRHSQSALKIAQYLSAHASIQATHYPGLQRSAQLSLASTQQLAGGGMLAFELDPKIIPAFLQALQYITLAENLGAAESLITHPATMTHSQIPASERERLGIKDGLLRLSVGLEESDDLIRDLDCALRASRAVLVGNAASESQASREEVQA